MRMATSSVDEQLEVAARAGIRSSFKSNESLISSARHIRRAPRPVGNGSETATRSTIFLPPNGLVPETLENIDFCPATTALRSGNQQRVLLDPIVPRYATNAAIKDSRSLAERLKHADPYTFGLLECKGLFKEPEDMWGNTSRLSLVFRLPSLCATPQSVRGRLLGGTEDAFDSLTDRIDLAKQLVRAVSYVHVYDFVHKNIRPDTILILSTTPPSTTTTMDTGNTSETAVLVGFESFRSADGNTGRHGDDKWENNIYRHPSRQGLDPEVDYDMRHDIYSVGVCLLEIGLWDSFVTYEQKGEELVPLLNSKIAQGWDRKKLFKHSNQVKSHLLQLARGELKRSVGTRYSQVVETCLTCLDEGNVDFGSEKDFEDEDGIAVGVKYIEKVIAKLTDIVI